MGKKLLLLSAVFGAGALFVSSCGGESSPTASSGQKVGTLKLGVKFPSSGELSGQFIDPATQCIEVSVYSDTYSFYKFAILTPDSPTATITVPVGDNYIWVDAYDGPPATDGPYCTGNRLDYASAYASIVEGTNSFTINLLRAKWVFVDSNGNPTPITLNGTLSTSNESIDGFYVLPWDISLIPASIDPSAPWSSLTYAVFFFGSNLGACSPTTDAGLCYSDGMYALQLIGPNTSNNAFTTFSNVNSSYGTLQPGPNGESRGFYIAGMPPCMYLPDCTDTFSDPSAENYLDTTVVSSDTMQGHIAEFLLKSYSYQETCYLDPNDPQGTQVTCPSASTSTQSRLLQSAVHKALSGSQLTAQQTQTCMQDLTVTVESTYEANTAWYDGPQDTNDIDGDGNTSESLCDNNFDGKYDMNDDTNGDGNIECRPYVSENDGVSFYVDYTSSVTVDVCFHPFTAKAQAISSDDLNLIIQNR